MGFFFHAIKVPSYLSLALFIYLWSTLKSLAFSALTYIGLYKPPPEEDDAGDHTDDYIFILDGPCPSLIPIPIHVVVAAIKEKVPIIDYRDLLLKDEAAAAEMEVVPVVACTICMEAMEEYQEVRDLSRCSHVFHRDCLDTWVDSGHVTCPLCRSMLLPPKANLSRSAVVNSPRREDHDHLS